VSDIDYLVKTSKRFESLLSSIYGANGRGLAEKAKSVKHMLPDGVFKALRHIAYCRNSVMHDEGVSRIDNQATLQKMVIIANAHFNKHSTSNANVGSQSGYFDIKNRPNFRVGTEWRDSNPPSSGIGVSLIKGIGGVLRKVKSKHKKNNDFDAGLSTSAAGKPFADTNLIRAIIEGSRSKIKEFKELPDDAKKIFNGKKHSPNKIIESWCNVNNTNFYLDDQYIGKVNLWLNNMMEAKLVVDELDLNIQSTFFISVLPHNLKACQSDAPSKNIKKLIESSYRSKCAKPVSALIYDNADHIESLHLAITRPQLININGAKVKVNMERSDIYISCPSFMDFKQYRYKSGLNAIPQLSPDELHKLTIENNSVIKCKASASTLIEIWESEHDTVFIPNNYYINHLNVFFENVFRHVVLPPMLCNGEFIWSMLLAQNKPSMTNPFFDKDKAAIKKIKKSLKSCLSKTISTKDIGLDGRGNYAVVFEMAVPQLLTGDCVSKKKIEAYYLAKLKCSVSDST
jgi:hypothetical protein